MSSLADAAADAVSSVPNSIKKQVVPAWTESTDLKPLPDSTKVTKNVSIWGPQFTDRQHFIDMHFC
jgi:hypothetical protein